MQPRQHQRNAPHDHTEHNAQKNRNQLRLVEFLRTVAKLRFNHLKPRLDPNDGNLIRKRQPKRSGRDQVHARAIDLSDRNPRAANQVQIAQRPMKNCGAASPPTPFY